MWLVFPGLFLHYFHIFKPHTSDSKKQLFLLFRHSWTDTNWLTFKKQHEKQPPYRVVMTFHTFELSFLQKVKSSLRTFHHRRESHPLRTTAVTPPDAFCSAAGLALPLHRCSSSRDWTWRRLRGFTSSTTGRRKPIRRHSPMPLYKDAPMSRRWNHYKTNHSSNQ